MRTKLLILAASSLALAASALAQTPRQPRVAPGPGEPNWDVVLKERYGLSMFDDLLNPVRTTPESTPGLFRRAGDGPVKFAPMIALGLPSVTRGGWYRPGKGNQGPNKTELWSYQHKNTTEDLESGKNLPPPLAAGTTTSFDPGNDAFGLWVSNDGLKDGGVFTQPRLVAAMNERLAKQPYKAMIYPNKDKSTGKTVPHSFLIGWEYSTNDDFQDVVCQVDNVELVSEPTPAKP
jgi:hypothetical protein